MSALFFVLAAGMVAAALALVAPPLFSAHRDEAKKNAEDEAARRRQNISAARRRMRELRRRREQGDISEEDFSESRAEIERALLDDLAAESETRVARTMTDSDSNSNTDSGGGDGRGKWVAAILCAALPIASGALYLHLGEPRAIAGADAVMTDSSGAPSMDSVIASLRARLEDDPGNAQGWILLARSLATVGRPAEAADAFARARGLLGGDDAGLLAGEAEARARAAGGDFSGAPLRLLARALELDSRHPTALWLSGLAAMNRGDFPAAAKFWRRALPEVDDAEAAATLRELIARAETESELSAAMAAQNGTDDATGTNGISTEQEAESSPATAGGVGGVGGEDADGADGVGGEGKGGVGGVGVGVGVSLLPAFLGEADSDYVVFVFARAVSGPRIPLAAARRRVGDLPFFLVLTDAMAMTPQLRLSQFSEVDIVARISRSGTPQASPGDLYGEAKGVRVSGGERISLVIDRRVE